MTFEPELPDTNATFAYVNQTLLSSVTVFAAPLTEITFDVTYGPFVGFRTSVSVFANIMFAMFAPARSSK